MKKTQQQTNHNIELNSADKEGELRAVHVWGRRLEPSDLLTDIIMP